MTLLVLTHLPVSFGLSWLRPLLARMLSRLAGRSTALPERLEDWQLRDLNLTRVHPGPGHPTHIELP